VQLVTTLTNARRTDPDTSKRAAQNVNKRAGSQRFMLLAAFEDSSELTADEAMRKAGISERSCYWKRISELREAGHLELTGMEREGEMGSYQAVSRITLAGREALR
jgi:hypothetical protein